MSSCHLFYLILWPLTQLYFLSLSPPVGHSHPMDMPGRGLYDERDSGIARSGRLMWLRSRAQIDLHPIQLSVLLLMHTDFVLGSFKAKDELRSSVFVWVGSIFGRQAGIRFSEMFFRRRKGKKKTLNDLLKREGSRSSEWTVTQVLVTLTAVAASAAVIGM